tara:strand:+ start:484 stop:591 length:108 start_codon:yes stop_codon:yes gene_type:complete
MTNVIAAIYIYTSKVIDALKGKDKKNDSSKYSNSI